MILEENEFKALEMMQQYIFGIKMDIEFILDNTNTDEIADDELYDAILFLRACF